MAPWIANTIGILIAFILVQVNAIGAYYIFHHYKAYKASDRFVKVESLADLYGLDNPEVFIPQAPPDVPKNWTQSGLTPGWNDGDN